MAFLGGWRLTRTGIIFVIGVVVLAGLVTGGIFLVKNHGEAVRRDEAVKIAEQRLKDESEAASQPIAAEAPTSSSAGTDNTSEPQPESTTPSSNTSPSVTNLPETGPADAIGSTLILTILSLSVAMYVSSRRGTQHL